MKTNPPPDLQELVAAAGGHDKIPPAMWAAFDHAVAEYRRARRKVLADEKANPARDILAPGGAPEQAWPYARCVECRAEARFGYRNAAGELEWFCAKDRRAQWWADARRGGRP